LGITALVLALVGLVFGLVPLTGFLALILGMMAVLFGLLDWSRTRHGVATNRKMTVIGTVLGVGAAALGIWGIVIVFGCRQQARQRPSEHRPQPGCPERRDRLGLRGD
jgi:uncharacterized membrane protein